MSSEEYDVVILGGGPGGYVAAIHASKNGLQTALVESGKMGGTCLNRGCIPTKHLLREASAIESIRACQARQTICTDVGIVNWGAIYEGVFESVAVLRGGVEALLRGNGVKVFRGFASFVSNNVIQINSNDGQKSEVKAKNTIIATGSKPMMLPGLDASTPGVILSDEILEQEQAPIERLIIIGGGVIGVELATAFSRFGTNVRIIEACDQILPSLSQDITKILLQSLHNQSIDIHVGTKVVSVQKVIGSVRVGCEVGRALKYYEADRVLVAIGRVPNVEQLNLEAAGIHDAKRGIAINTMCQTAINGIYAIGDVTKGSTQLAHAASAQAIRAVDAILGQDVGRNDPLIPHCIYTDPEVAVVGLDEASATEQGIDVHVSEFPMVANSMSIIARQSHGFARLISNKANNELIGAQLICERATDMIAELSLAIANRLTLGDVANTIHPHPSYCEAIAEAAAIPLGRAIHIMDRRK